MLTESIKIYIYSAIVNQYKNYIKLLIFGDNLNKLKHHLMFDEKQLKDNALMRIHGNSCSSSTKTIEPLMKKKRPDLQCQALHKLN